MSQSQTIVIESGLPVPEKKKPRGRPRKYPFPQMKVGDSIYLEGAVRRGTEHRAAKKYAQDNDIVIATRVVPGGIRIWRIT